VFQFIADDRGQNDPWYGITIGGPGPTDPLAVSGVRVAFILFQSHRFDAAIREGRSVLAVHPDDASALLYLGFALTGNDQPGDAIPVLEKAISISNGGPAAIGVLIRAYSHAGRRSDAERLLAGLRERRKKGYIPAAAFCKRISRAGRE
jgi:Flp pilus assembly protein TadD